VIIKTKLISIYPKVPAVLPNEGVDPPKLNPVLAGSDPVDPKLKSFFLEELSPNEKDGAAGVGVGVCEVDPFPNLNPVSAGLLSTDPEEVVDPNPVEMDPSAEATLCLALSSPRCFS
jgi:hypothetical protein